MAIQQVNAVQEESKKGLGGAIGSLAGAVIGGAAGLIAGNPLGGAALGSSIGGTAGGIVDPGSQGNMVGGIPNTEVQDKMPIHSMQDHPEVQLSVLADAKNALKTAPLPADQFHELNNRFTMAQTELQNRLGRA